MGNMFKVGLILMVITAVSGASLAGIYNLTKDRIAAQEEKVKTQARQEVLPGVSESGFEEKTEDGITYWEGYNENSTKLGYVFECSGSGYSSNIQITVGVDTNFEIEGIEITFQQETPGLGAKIVEVKPGKKEPWFEEQFDGKKLPALDVMKDGGKIQSVTGATISSRAVTEAIDKSLGELKKALKDKRGKEVDE
jgi:electron transport complex protein RnfG